MSSIFAIHKGVAVGTDMNGNAATENQSSGITGSANAISDAGIAGYDSQDNGGFFWQNSVFDVFPPISFETGINNSGMVVGEIGSGRPVGSRRFVLPKGSLQPTLAGPTRANAWTSTDGMVDLNDRVDQNSWVLVIATGVNDDGKIVGSAMNSQTNDEM